MSTNFFKSGFVIPGAGASASNQSLCPSDLPLVLLPVRLETRFFTPRNGSTELRVRIFPDKIHLDSHEPELTADEQTWGQHYWQQDWLAGNDSVARSDAWRQIADRFGENRAAWIARLLQPTNANMRPVSPTPAGHSLAVAPLFPAVALAGQTVAWRHAPQARLLPDRWIAILHSGGQVAATVTGKDVKKPLNVGPDPQAPLPDAQTEAAILRGEQLAIDPGMKWLTDFNEAESSGMALRIPISATALTAGLDSLVVFGVSRSLNVADTSEKLADLLDAHHYTDGLAFVRPGTPTNNTDNRRAGYSSQDPGHQRSFALEVAVTPTLDNNNASGVGIALGIRHDRIAPTFGRVDRGLERDDLGMRSMNIALWQVGWGYFLTNMISGEASLTQASVDWVRGHFRDYVRAFGPFPALRCGTQPYGVLPVTSLDLWQPGTKEPFTAQDSWLRGMLINLRDNVWRQAAGSVARIGNRQTPPDPDADLADVMRMDALSGVYQTRSIFGQYFLQYLNQFLASSSPASDPGQIALLQRLGIVWHPRLSRLWNADWQWTVSAPLIQSGEVSPWTQLEPNYIAALLAEPHIQQLIQLRPDPQSTSKTASLLQVLLRHALLREIAGATALLQANETGADPLGLQRDAELIDLVTGAPPTLHWQRQLDKKLNATGNRTIRDYLETQTAFTTPALAALGEFRSSLTTLKDLDTEALSHLMQGTLDLSTHRLDAWVTSFATKRLSAMRANGPEGQYVGGYGWVENLKPFPAAAIKQISSLPPGESGPLQAPVNDSGFIHAPSMAHAVTAALLRNAHLGPTGVPNATGPFAIDLSSRRAREASRLLEGVRQGQPLGALLGYRLERALHDTFVDNGRSMDRFIAPLRRIAPLVVRANPNSTAPVDTVAANNVVDGLVLHRRWKEEQNTVLGELAKEGMGTSDLSTLTAILQKLDDAIDGLSDALTAEAAYQMARGNTSRIASTLSAIAQGDAPPPDLEVTRTPRTGTSLTHRLMLVMSGTDNPASPGWAGAAAGMRSNAEPMLNFWAAKLLGDASKIRCTIERLNDATGAVAETRTLPLSELSITPLDLVYGVEAANTTAQPGMSLSDIEQQVLYYAKHKAGGFDPLATLRLQHARPNNLTAGEVTLFDVLEQARTVRRLLSTARGLDPDDLNPPERATQGTIDLTELENRVVRAENALNASHVALNNLVTKPTGTTAESLRAALLKLGAFGVGPAVPISPAGEDPVSIVALTKQGDALLKISSVRLSQGAALRAVGAAAEPRARCDQLVLRMRAVFGDSFTVLPQFSFIVAGAAEFANALASSTAAQGGDPLAVNTWFARCAQARDAVARLGSCLQRAEVLGTGAKPNLSVAQLPFIAGERWVGLPPLPAAAMPPSKLSLVLHTVGAINASQVITGLLVDEWVETIPNSRETTALAFQFDGPNSCAAQSVLIAVPPVPGQDWTTETLRRVLMETLDLAKLRAVDTGSLGQAAQYLPGLYLALNTSDHAVSTDFKPLTV
ncbi:MAG: hypothetical protein JOY77_05025 [Alphaproteobacteria bacterium]|nr:hypothetical protein [Alphaproteobacteria bacterium]